MRARDRLNEFAIYMISFISMVAICVSPALAIIQREFTWASPLQIQLLVTLPSLGMVPAAFLSPALQKRFSIKSLFLSNLIVAVVFGIVPLFVDNYSIILLSRVFSGFSLGFIQILLSVAITTRFQPADQGRVMGGRTAATSLGVIVIAYLSGVLADINWQLAFLPYLVIVPAIVISWIGLHKMAPLPQEPSKPEPQREKKKLLDAVTVLICVSALVHTVFLQTFSTNSALFIDQEKFGSAAVAGAGMSVYQVGGLVCGLFMSKLYRRLRGKALFFGFLASAVGILLTGFAMNRYLVYAGGFFAGFGLSALLGFGPLDITGTIPKERVQLPISLFAIAIFFGTFLTPFVVLPAANLIRPDSVRMRFLFAGVMIVLQAVIYELIRRRRFAACYEQTVATAQKTPS